MPVIPATKETEQQQQQKKVRKDPDPIPKITKEKKDRGMA
jgi:hypothetical protein